MFVSLQTNRDRRQESELSVERVGPQSEVVGHISNFGDLWHQLGARPGQHCRAGGGRLGGLGPHSQRVGPPLEEETATGQGE